MTEVPQPDRSEQGKNICHSVEEVTGERARKHSHKPLPYALLFTTNRRRTIATQKDRQKYYYTPKTGFIEILLLLSVKWPENTHCFASIPSISGCYFLQADSAFKTKLQLRLIS